MGVVSGLRQLLEFGLFHGDPHPGNIFAMRDGRIAYVDFGNVAVLSQQNKQVRAYSAGLAVTLDTLCDERPGAAGGLMTTNSDAPLLSLAGPDRCRGARRERGLRGDGRRLHQAGFPGARHQHPPHRARAREDLAGLAGPVPQRLQLPHRHAEVQRARCAAGASCAMPAACQVVLVADPACRHTPSPSSPQCTSTPSASPSATPSSSAPS